MLFNTRNQITPSLSLLHVHLCSMSLGENWGQLILIEPEKQKSEMYILRGSRRSTLSYILTAPFCSKEKTPDSPRSAKGTLISASVLFHSGKLSVIMFCQ